MKNDYELYYDERRAYNQELWSRIGRFVISDELLRRCAKQVVDLLAGILILECQWAAHQQANRYVGCSLKFDPWLRPENTSWVDAPIYPVDRIERLVDGGLILWKLEFGAAEQGARILPFMESAT